MIRDSYFADRGSSPPCSVVSEGRHTPDALGIGHRLHEDRREQRRRRRNSESERLARRSTRSLGRAGRCMAQDPCHDVLSHHRAGAGTADDGASLSPPAVRRRLISKKTLRPSYGDAAGRDPPVGVGSTRRVADGRGHTGRWLHPGLDARISTRVYCRSGDPHACRAIPTAEAIIRAGADISSPRTILAAIGATGVKTTASPTKYDGLPVECFAATGRDEHVEWCHAKDGRLVSFLRGSGTTGWRSFEATRAS